jgi:hypothetical protein
MDNLTARDIIEKNKKLLGLAWGFGSAMVVVVVGLLIYFVGFSKVNVVLPGSNNVTVTDVTGQTLSDATAALEELGFTVTEVQAPSDTIAIDTENPEVNSTTPSIVMISDDDVVNGFALSITYNEPMDTLVTPQLNYIADNPLASSMIQDEAASRWLNPSTFEAIYLLADAGEELNSINLEVSNAFDINGNAQTMTFSANNVFAIDTRNPLVTEVIPSMNVIQSDDIGEAMFSVAITFDESMGNDSAPEISFISTPMLNLPLNAQSEWTSIDTYTALFDVPGDIEQIASVDLNVGGNVQDAAGNLAESFTLSNAFSVDIVINLNGEHTAKSGISIFPNPAYSGNSLTLFAGAEKMTNLEIVDMLGKTVFSQSLQPMTIQTTTLTDCSPGMYTARVTTERGIFTQSIMIIH